MRPSPSIGRKEINSLFRNQNHDTSLILLNRTETNPKVVWKLLYDLNPKDEKETTQFLNVNHQNLENPIANAFNTHFTNIIDKIRQGSDPYIDIKISGK